MTNFKQLSTSFPADTSPISRSSGEWVNLYTRAHKRRQKCMRDAEVMRVDVLKQRENEMDKYRREQITGGPAKSRVTSLTVSKTPAGRLIFRFNFCLFSNLQYIQIYYTFF